ncbi:hypothetical protein H6P81_002103 [Aristolochia fimbriata]|uniref:DRBM domain-containing protein n=1 Tax=Aristolochia fimbriata TaxID=158543 RepID=A0AAV7F8W1_ARIFI|nr:hypothetical protein H6P81_002103 [Aristolochia fimbriata]
MAAFLDCPSSIGVNKSHASVGKIARGMYKNQLQELAQRSCFNLPSYACIREGPDHAPRFKATVNFNGEIFESPHFCTTLRQAEHAAAEVALNTLSKRGPSRSLAAKVLDETGVYKNLLQETAHRAGLNLPVYTTVRSGPGHVPVFSCTVELAGMSFSGDPAKTKKQAQKNAAMAAWSALKQLPSLTTSTSSTCDSTPPDSEGNEEQEQVIVARALASLCSSDGNKLAKQNDRHRGRRRQHPPLRGTYQTSGVSLYPMPYQPWRYHNLSAELAMYQMWQHDQVSQQLCQLLTLPAPPPPSGPRILPIIQSMVQPDHAQYFPAREEQPISRLPDSSIYFTDQVVQDSARNRSQVTIKEIHDEKTLGENKDKVCGTSDGSGDLDHQTPISFPKIQELMEDRQQSNGLGTTNIGSSGGEPVKGKSCSKLPMLFQGASDKKKAEEIQIEGNQKDRLRWVSSVACGSILDGRETDAVPNHSSSHNLSSCYSVQGSRRQYHPSFVGYSGVSRGFSRPPLVAAPVTVRTAVPVYSPRPRPQNLHIRSPPVNSMAPAVQIRSVIPVCSAPPARKVPAPTQEKPSVDSRGHDSGEIAAVSSELGKLGI